MGKENLYVSEKSMKLVLAMMVVNNYKLSDEEIEEKGQKSGLSQKEIDSMKIMYPLFYESKVKAFEKLEKERTEKEKYSERGYSCDKG